jgi:hypothetical protein
MTINRILPLSVLTLGVGLLFASVSTDYDHQANFSRYHTYSWIKAEANDSLWVDRITSAIDGKLQAKGWQKTPSGGDASVAAFGHTHNERTLQTFYDGLGGGWFWRGFGGGMATTTVENQPIGTLTVDIFDASTKKLIFRASGSDALSSHEEKNEKKLDHTVDEMFKHFPPNSKD